MQSDYFFVAFDFALDAGCCRYLEASTSGHDIAVYKVDPSPLEGKMVCYHLLSLWSPTSLEDNILLADNPYQTHHMYSL